MRGKERARQLETVPVSEVAPPPTRAHRVPALVDDAVSKGARVLNGGFVPSRGDPLASGSFYPPTVLCDVPESALIAQKEIFGPIMCIFKVRDMGSPAAKGRARSSGTRASPRRARAGPAPRT